MHSYFLVNIYSHQCAVLCRHENCVCVMPIKIFMLMFNVSCLCKGMFLLCCVHVLDYCVLSLSYMKHDKIT